MSNITTPPTALVNTWVSLINSNENNQVRNHAANMLIGAFGDLKAAADFCKQNNIALQKRPNYE